ncbi:hypothetical protein [Pseudomonas sp. 3A(2025)]
MPSWKKSWCYISSIQCTEHMTELSSCNVRPSIDKAWKCFGAMIGFPQRISAWNDPKFIRRRACFVRQLERLNYLSTRNIGNDSGDAQNNFAAIYTLSLRPRTYRHAAGWAVRLACNQRSIYRGLNDEFSSMLARGPGLSGPRQRFIAALLASWIMQLVPSTKLGYLIAHVRNAGVRFPEDVFTFGCQFLTVSTLIEHEAVMAFFTPVACSPADLSDLFINGLRFGAETQLR